MLRALREAASAHGMELQLLRPESLEQATAALGNGSVALGGGTEVVPLLRDHLLEARRSWSCARSCRAGWTAPASAQGRRCAELEADPEVPAALREACRLAASPQVRAMGTIGGNLLRRPVAGTGG
jgi:xanthine dehydrogenase YagS FAD-binding subunit